MTSVDNAAAGAGARKAVLGIMAVAMAAVFVTSFVYRMEHPSLKAPTAVRGMPAGGGGEMGAGQMQAIRELMARAEREPENVEVLTSLGEVFMRIGSFERALDFLTRADKVAPGNVDVLERLGVAYFETDRPRESAEVFERMLQADPNNGQAHFNLGFIQRHKLGQEEQGLAHLRRALELTPEGEPARKMILEELARKPEQK